jgi:hypothetical protein
MGQEQTASPSRAITLPDEPAALAERLVELSQARFDLQYKTFGVQEVLEKVDLAYGLRMAAARLEGNKEAELATAKNFHRQLQQISTAAERSYQGTTTPIIDRELVRYRVQKAAGEVARHAGNKTAEIECCRKAVAATAELRRALVPAYEAGVLPWTDMLKLSWHHCEARLALIDLTADEPAEAMKTRAAVLGELLDLADEVFEARDTLFKIGLVSSEDLDLVRVERSRIAAYLARERGNRDEELSAVRCIVDAQRSRLQRVMKSIRSGAVAHSEYEKAQSQVFDAEFQLSELQARHEFEEAQARHDFEEGGHEPTHVELQLAHARLRKLKADLDQAHGNLQIQQILYSEGACDALAVIEAAVLDRLADISLRQCHLDLAELQKNLKRASSAPRH